MAETVSGRVATPPGSCPSDRAAERPAPAGGDPSRGVSLLRRMTLCKLSLCETFKTASDESGIWGECQKCGKRVGYVDRRSLREIGRREFERHQEASRG